MTEEQTKARDDLTTILRIATRACEQVQFFKDQPGLKSALIMDIENFHRLQPLDLPRLLEVTDGSFHHDIHGIWNHYDRQADAITGCFVARTAQCNHPQS